MRRRIPSGGFCFPAEKPAGIRPGPEPLTGREKKEGIALGEQAESRLAVVAVVVENPDSVSALNELLHQYSGWIIGRMGIPCPRRSISLISVAMDAPGDAVSALTGKLGRLNGVSVKTAYSKA